MDPVSALGVASATVQFLDYASKLLAGTIKVYKSSDDTTGANKDLKAIAENLHSLNQRVIISKPLKATSPTTEFDGAEIEQLCIACNQVAVELIEAIEKLQKRDGSLWASFRIALKTMWSEGEINSLQQRVDGYRQQISLHILVHIQ
jgi:Fungal N-terminal domain of STAND proteins